ncbi:hypothetical protein, partial [Escherichia coli]|uniref:hypothetical protein n=1 Tax=Escherichia coli TaxID=562 RepID=UPI003F84DC09
ADRNRSHWSTSKTPSYTKSVSWQHHPFSQERKNNEYRMLDRLESSLFPYISGFGSGIGAGL